MRNVMIGAPSHDGANNVWHTCALVETTKLALANDINIIPIYMSYDSLVQRARNDIIKLAYDMEVDDLIFMDTDQDWNPLDLLKLLEYDVDVIGCPVPKKSDVPSYNVKLVSMPYKKLENGLVEVDSIGTGFMRISKKAIKESYEAAPEYVEDSGKSGRMVFNVEIRDGKLVSEDVIFCANWKGLGGKVYIDPTINSAHSGNKRWLGDFEPWVAHVLGLEDDRSEEPTDDDDWLQPAVTEWEDEEI